MFGRAHPGRWPPNAALAPPNPTVSDTSVGRGSLPPRSDRVRAPPIARHRRVRSPPHTYLRAEVGRATADGEWEAHPTLSDKRGRWTLEPAHRSVDISPAGERRERDSSDPPRPPPLRPPPRPGTALRYGRTAVSPTGLPVSPAHGRLVGSEPSAPLPANARPTLSDRVDRSLSPRPVRCGRGSKRSGRGGSRRRSLRGPGRPGGTSDGARRSTRASTTCGRRTPAVAADRWV